MSPTLELKFHIYFTVKINAVMVTNSSFKRNF